MRNCHAKIPISDGTLALKHVHKIPNIERVGKLLIAQSIYAESDLQSVTLSILGIL
jgi:hypothetical protein